MGAEKERRTWRCREQYFCDLKPMAAGITIVTGQQLAATTTEQWFGCCGSFYDKKFQ
jgi:hypothetical protein